ncbi:MAG: hypothetical protein IPJ40_18510 [Saprospirales bacterium]|nr:hypothetical protein [Saprospirales bacterium]
MLRGGSWNNNTRNCRVSNRNNNNPDNRNNNNGFRVVQHCAVFWPESSASRPRGVCQGIVQRLFQCRALRGLAE